MGDASPRYHREIAELRARLTTAEQERDYRQAQADEWRDRAFAAKDVLKTANDNCERLDGERAAAEARVEAAEQAADSIIDLAQTFILAGDRAKFLARVAAIRPGPARAALACPPQQRGE